MFGSNHNTASKAIRALIILRDHEDEELSLMDWEKLCASVEKAAEGFSQSTGMLSMPPRESFKALVATGAVQARHKNENNYLTPEQFAEQVSNSGPNSIQNFRFSISPRLGVIQKTFGINSLRELERRAIGDSIVVRPVFRRAQMTSMLSRDIFVAMPFAEAMMPVFSEAIRPAARQVGLNAFRADDIFSSHTIMDVVWESIYSSKIVIADCTGRNVNVFYELGMAHTIGKPCIILAQDRADIPFDISHFRHIIYTGIPDGIPDLYEQLVQALQQMVEHTD